VRRPRRRRETASLRDAGAAERRRRRPPAAGDADAVPVRRPASRRQRGLAGSRRRINGSDCQRLASEATCWAETTALATNASELLKPSTVKPLKVLWYWLKSSGPVAPS
jgi:hypothetical protein